MGSWNLKSLVSRDLLKWEIIIINIVIIIIIIIIIILSLLKGRCWQILLVSLYDGGLEISWKSMQKICHEKKKMSWYLWATVVKKDTSKTC